MTDRILWNRRPEHPGDSGDIDEIVISDCTVHIEQMSTDCYSVAIRKPDGAEWQGNFFAHHGLGRVSNLVLSEQESDIQWVEDRSHEDPQ